MNASNIFRNFRRMAFSAGAFVLLCGVSSICLTQPVENLATTQGQRVSSEEEAKWRSILDQFKSAWSDSDSVARQRLVDQYMSVDLDAIPSEYRWAYYSKRLLWHHNNGEWGEMLKIRDRLMRPRDGKKDALVDADILLQISDYFCNNIFYPPKDFALSADEQAKSKEIREYWRSHYSNYGEGERIYQYIIDNFDANYAPVQRSIFNIAEYQERQGKHEIALQNYKRFERIDFNSLYSIPRFDPGQERLLSGPEQLKREKEDLSNSIAALPREMVYPALGLEPSRAIIELNSIKRAHPEDAKLQAIVDQQLNIVVRAKSTANSKSGGN